MHKASITGLFGGTFAMCAAIITDVYTHLEAWLRLLTLLVGLLVALVAGWYMWRAKRIQLIKDETALCEACTAGHPPTVCPIPEDERPSRCPIWVRIKEIKTKAKDETLQSH